MLSLLFSLIIVIADMIVSLLTLHWAAIRWAFINRVIVRAIHHRLRIKRPKARIVQCRGGGLLWVGAVGEGVVAVAQSVKTETGCHSRNFAICLCVVSKLIFINQVEWGRTTIFTWSWTSDADMARIPSRCARCRSKAAAGDSMSRDYLWCDYMLAVDSWRTRDRGKELAADARMACRWRKSCWMMSHDCNCTQTAEICSCCFLQKILWL